MAHREISARQREALALIEVGHSYSQAAALMGVAKGTVQIHVRRARIHLSVSATGQVAWPASGQGDERDRRG